MYICRGLVIVSLVATTDEVQIGKYTFWYKFNTGISTVVAGRSDAVRKVPTTTFFWTIFIDYMIYSSIAKHTTIYNIH